MTNANLTRKQTGSKSRKQTGKPYPDYPLTRHPSGRWVKKIRGRTYYFGPVEDPDAALRKYLEVRDRLQAGLPAIAPATSPTVRFLVNAFLTEKERQVTTGEITRQTFEEYKRECGAVLDVLTRERTLGELVPDDFARLRVARSKDVGPVTAGGRIRRCRVLFKYAYDVGLADSPLRYLVTLKLPSRRMMRLAIAERGLKMLEVGEARSILLSASPMIKAALLLALNCGLGNRDVATISTRHIDLESGWLSMPRRKTGVMRRCPLWPETVAALREFIATRPTPRDPRDENLVFLSQAGTPLVQEKTGASGRLTRVDLLSQGFSELCKRLGINRSGLSFYSARHTLQTVGEETGDFVAVRAVMGHADGSNDMSAQYRARITDERLQRVVDHLRKWLF